MAITKFLILAVLAVALLPAGRAMLDDMLRELSGTHAKQERFTP